MKLFDLFPFFDGEIFRNANILNIGSIFQFVKIPHYPVFVAFVLKRDFDRSVFTDTMMRQRW